MRLIIENTGSELATNAVIARSFKARLQGLLGKASLNSDEALVLPSCQLVHMFFMKFAIDVLFCDEDGVVLRAVEDLKPWCVSPYVWGANYVVELASGRVKEVGVTIGDKIKIIS